MTRHGAFVVAFLLVGFLGLVPGCGVDPCQECADKFADAVNTECDARPDCLFCTCHTRNQVVNSSGDGCEDLPPPDPMFMEPPCEGDTRDVANALLDTGRCGNDAVTVVERNCP